MTLPWFDLMEGDCYALFAEIDDASIDAIVTDPPYGMDFQSNWSKSGPRHAAIVGDASVDGAWVSEAYRVLRDGGALISFCDWRTSCDWRRHIENAGFQVKSQVIWDRMHHGMGDLKGAFAPQHDVIWYATKGRRVFVNGRPKSVIRVQRPSPGDDNGHPTCKPVDLMAQLIKAIDDGKTSTIMDPFIGSGSTGVAAMQLGLNFIGSEIVSDYLDTAEERIANAKQEAQRG